MADATSGAPPIDLEVLVAIAVSAFDHPQASAEALRDHWHAICAQRLPPLYRQPR
jgi:hypothetical protein